MEGVRFAELRPACGLLLCNCLDRTAPAAAAGVCAGVLQPTRRG